MRLGSRCNVQRGGVIEIVTPRSLSHVKAGASSVTLPIVTQVGGPGCPSQHHQFVSTLPLTRRPYCKTAQTLVSTLYVRIRHPYDAMAPIDFDNYYAEQEERMGMPDETMQEYLRRVALSKRRFVWPIYERVVSNVAPTVQVRTRTRRPRGNLTLRGFWQVPKAYHKIHLYSSRHAFTRRMDWMVGTALKILEDRRSSTPSVSPRD